MTIQTINIGNLANDGTGDDLREAFIKVNNNFTELNNTIISTDTTGQNLGSGEGIFVDKLGENLQFKSLRARDNITLDADGNSIYIDAIPSLKQLEVKTDNDGSITASPDIGIIPLYGGQNITTRVSTQESGNQNIYIDVDGEGLLSLDTTPRLSATLNANSKDILGAKDISALRFLGNLDGLVHGIDIRELNDSLINFDLGQINITATSVIDFIVLSTEFDFGSFSNPLTISVDGGSF